MPNSTALNRISNIVLARVGNILSITKKILVEEKYIPYLKKNGKYIYVNSENLNPVGAGKEYDNMFLISEVLASINLKGKWGLIDKYGKEVVPIRFEEIIPQGELIWGRKKTGMLPMGLINRIGFNHFTETAAKQILSYCAGPLVEGFVKVHSKKDKWGFIDKTGNLAIPIKWDQIGDFSEGLARVKLNFNWGYINRSGEIVIPLKYEEVRSFKGNYASIKMDGKWGCINRTGRQVVPPIYDYFGGFDEGLFQVELNGKWGYINQTGN